MGLGCEKLHSPEGQASGEERETECDQGRQAAVTGPDLTCGGGGHSDPERFRPRGGDHRS